MLPIHEMKWRSGPGRTDRETRLTGQLCFYESHHIDNEYRSETEHIKERLKMRLWREIYGELSSPLAELQLYARKNANVQDYVEVGRLCEQINTLLAFPKNPKPAATVPA